MVSVGSTNFDNRSFSINDEAKLNVLDADFAHQQVGLFYTDWQHSRRMTLSDWQDRAWLEKIGGKFAALIGAQL